MDYNYKFFKTDKKNSFYKSVIQALSKDYATDEDVQELEEDIMIFFKKPDFNYNKNNLYDYIIDTNIDIIYMTIPRESDDIYDLYFKFTMDTKDIYPLFSKKIKQEITQNSIFYNAFNYKYLNFYIQKRIPKKDKNLLSISLDFIKEEKYQYDIVNDALSLNIILLDENLNYYTTYENSDNDEYIVLKKDNQNNFSNIYFSKDEEDIYILNKYREEELIDYLQSKTQSKYKNVTQEGSLDYILQNIENSIYSVQDFIDISQTVYKDNKN
tara:strand:+ start:933 stop:1739 length:807 start_codon:yes stop_codon:yes gene_type:complete